MLIFSTVLSAIPSIVVIREVAEKESVCTTLQLVQIENSDYPVGMIKQTDKKGWRVQLYKDGGDGVISPLDAKGNPTGDDQIVTDPFNVNSAQKLVFPIKRVWLMNGYKFADADSAGQVFISDKIYVRVFNNASISKADKYLVSHSLYTVPQKNEVVNYIPDYGWDSKGWIKFRNK